MQDRNLIFSLVVEFQCILTSSSVLSVHLHIFVYCRQFCVLCLFVVVSFFHLLFLYVRIYCRVLCLFVLISFIHLLLFVKHMYFLHILSCLVLDVHIRIHMLSCVVVHMHRNAMDNITLQSSSIPLSTHYALGYISNGYYNKLYLLPFLHHCKNMYKSSHLLFSNFPQIYDDIFILQYKYCLHVVHFIIYAHLCEYCINIHLLT